MIKNFILFFILFLYIGFAEVEEKQLDNIIVTTEKDFSFTNKKILSKEDMKLRQATNLSEIFNKESSIDVGGGGNMAQKLYIRGMEDRLLRISIDGSAQNGNAFHHQGNLLVDANMIKNIEIIKGAANASVGPGALAGNIKITTKDALDFLENNQKFGVSLKSGIFSNFGIEESIAIYGSDHKNFDILAMYNFLNTFYYRDGKHTFKNFFSPTKEDKVLGSPSMQNNFLFKSNIFVTQKDKITLNYNLIYDSATRPFRANITRVDPSLNGGVDFGLILFKHKNSNHNFSLSYQRDGSQDFNTPKIKISSYGNVRNINLLPYKMIGNTQKDEEGSLPRNIFLNNFGLDLNIIHTLNHQKQNNFEYGLNYQNIFTTDKKMVKTQEQKGSESAHIIGGYLQTNYYILENLSLGAGTRYDSYFYSDKNYQNHHTFGFSPSFALLYSPIDSINLKFSYAYVTRGALPTDALLLQNAHHFVAKNLKAEKGQNIELNVDYSYHDYLTIRGAVFYQNIKDFINSYGNGHHHEEEEHHHDDHDEHHDSIKNNLDSLIDIYGFEAGINYFFKNFFASFSFSRSFPMVKGHLIADTYELGAAVGNTYIVRIGYDFKSSGINISWVSRFVQRLKYNGYDIYNDEFSNIDKRGYQIHNIYLSYTHPKHKNCSLYFAIENLLNQYYINQASPFKVEADGSAREQINSIRAALPEKGLNVKLSVTYKF